MPKSAIERVKAIFVEAVEKTGAERQAFLAKACGNDTELLAEVQAFLSDSERAGDFLTSPTVGSSSKIADSPQAPSLEGPGVVIGQYKLLQLIGEGGFGCVFMAEQERPVRRKVAMKIIKLGMDTKQVIARFEAERQALAIMDHPNIAKVFEAGATETGRPYFVMELVRGIPITEFCDSHKLTTRQRVELFVQVCHAIEHAHQKGITHRDIKPGNVLVTMHDDKAVPKVIDFGIAKATGQNLTEKTLFTEFRQFLGTPAYMSPEQTQMNEVDVDTRSDIYSLGVLLYELLTGTTPFDPRQLRSAAYDEVLRIIREVYPPKPSTRISALGDTLHSVAEQRSVEPSQFSHSMKGELDWIVMKAMEKDRTRRYETASGLGLDIQRYLNDEPVLARPSSSAYRFRKLVRRNKLAFGAAAIISLLLIVGICTSIWLAVRASRARDEAQNAEKGQAQLRADAETAEAMEATLRRQAERAMLISMQSQAFGLIDQADALRTVGALVEARQRSEEAYGKFVAAKLPPLEADLCLWTQNSISPPSLMTYDEPDAVYCSAICPDGRTALSGNRDGLVRIWDLPAGRLIRTLRGHTDQLREIAISPDGRIAASGGYDKTIILWDIASGQKLRECHGHTGAVFGLAFGPDGRKLLSASQDRTLKLWDVVTARELGTFTGHTDKVDAVAFSPDGLTALSGCGDGTMKLWNVASGQVVRTFSGHVNTVRYVGFTPDGRTALSCSSDQFMKSWDVATGQERKTFNGHRAEVSGFGVNADGYTLVSASSDRTLKLWDIASGREIRTFTGHNGFIRSVAITPNGRMAFSASVDKTCKLWDLTGMQELRTLGPDDLSQGEFSLDGRLVLSHSWMDGKIRLFDVATGRELRTLPETFWGWGLTADGRSAIVIYNDCKTVGLVDLVSGRARPLFATSQRINGFNLSPDSRMVATTDVGQILQVCDLATGRKLHSMPISHSGNSGIIFSPDSQTILLGFSDGTVSKWDIATERKLSTFQIHKANVGQLIFSPDGRSVLSGSQDSELALWDFETGRVLRRFAGHFGSVITEAFLHDGHVAVSGSVDHTFRFWDVETGRLLRTFFTDEDGVSNISVNVDGKTMVTSGVGRGRLKLWNFGRTQTYRDMQPKVEAAQKILQDNPNDPSALLTMAQWWDFRGVFDWAADLFEKARSAGANISDVELGRCYWNLNRYADAKREFSAALAASNDPNEQFYLKLCIQSVGIAATQPSSTVPSSVEN